MEQDITHILVYYKTEGSRSVLETYIPSYIELITFSLYPDHKRGRLWKSCARKLNLLRSSLFASGLTLPAIPIQIMRRMNQNGSTRWTYAEATYGLPRIELGTAQHLQLLQKSKIQGEAHYGVNQANGLAQRTKYNFAAQYFTTTSHFPASVFSLFEQPAGLSGTANGRHVQLLTLSQPGDLIRPAGLTVCAGVVKNIQPSIHRSLENVESSPTRRRRHSRRLLPHVNRFPRLLGYARHVAEVPFRKHAIRD